MSDEIEILVQPSEVIIITVPLGPPGATGPAGPPGAAGSYVVVTASSTIPVNQLFTFVNSASDTTQTLPQISAVLIGNITTAYQIYNAGTGQVTVLGFGSDAVQFGSSLIIPFKKDSVTLIPTTEFGWVIV